MSAQPHESFQEAVKELRRSQEQLRSVRKEMQAKATKVTSKDGMIWAVSLISFPENDEVSKLFSEQWNSLVNGAKGMLLGFRDGMTGVAGNVFDTAALYQKSNEVNTESVTPPPTLHR